MRKRKVMIGAIIVALCLIAIIIIYYIILAVKAPPPLVLESSTGSCTDLGCPSDTLYVGSINSDKYYSCDCGYAHQINSENIHCFDSHSEADSQGYIQIPC